MKRTAPAPDQALARLLGAAQLNKSLRLQPLRAAPAPWNLGWGTIKGPVRSRNEDYVLAFESGENRIIVLADGVGGEPFGGRASSMACQIAARHALLKLGASWRGTEPNPEVVALCALLQAEEGLGRIASACRCPTGFKTTLIVVVATPAAYGFAHVGDGRGCVLRETGSLEHFVLAQRGENDGPHVISACLGPNLLGSPRHGLLPRASGDLLVVGSDGVFSECVQWEVDLALNLRQAALQCRGHLQLTVDLTLSELSQARDEHGYLFDDNLSLVILGTGQAPQSPSRAPVLPTEGIPHAEVPDPVTNSPWPSSAPDQVGQERTSAIS
jgi:serine/threonine protein phosphatase PrpC